MKPLSIRIILVVLAMCSSTINNAHDYRLISARISKTEGSNWELMLDFKTSNILESLQQYYQDETLSLSNTKDFKERLKKYLDSKISIEVIKHFDIKLGTLDLDFNPHVTNIIVSLQGVPARPDYWNIQIGCGTESNMQTVMLRFDTGDQSRLLKLSAKNDYQTALIKGHDGMIRTIKN